MTSEEKEQLDISWLYRLDSYNTHGWQFRIAESTPDAHTKLFSDSGRHSDISLQEARDYRNAYLASHPNLRAARTPVWLILPKNNRTGILGVSFTEGILPSGTPTATWQMTCPRVGGGPPKTASRSANLPGGETMALMVAVTARRDATSELLAAEESEHVSTALRTLISEYDDIISDLKESLARDVESDLLKIIRAARLDATTKQAQIRVRIGQHRFRRLVLDRASGRCSVTGATILLTASHIKPWRDSSSFDRINPDNGLALSALYDRAFDAGYITFGDDGSLTVAPTCEPELERLGIDFSARVAGLTRDHQPYLRYHRERVFRLNIPKSVAISLVPKLKFGDSFVPATALPPSD